MNVGGKKNGNASNLSVGAGQVSSLLANQNAGKDSVIATNMQLIATYSNILKTDVPGLLDNATDRQNALQSFLDDLQYHSQKAQDQITSIQNDLSNVQATLNASSANLTQIKNRLSAAYGSFDADATKTAFNDYVTESGNNAYNRAYVLLLSKFVSAYQTLNAYEVRLYGTLNANQEALIKNVTVVLPKTGNDLMQPLDLLKNE